MVVNPLERLTPKRDAAYVLLLWSAGLAAIQRSTTVHRMNASDIRARCHAMSIRYTERLAEAGIEPSVGRVGDSYDNALAETVIGLFKAEVIRRSRP